MVELAPVLEALAKQTEALAKQYLLNGGRLKSRKLVKRHNGGVVAVDLSDPRPGLDIPAVFEAGRQSLEAARLLR